MKQLELKIVANVSERAWKVQFQFEPKGVEYAGSRLEQGGTASDEEDALEKANMAVRNWIHSYFSFYNFKQ